MIPEHLKTKIANRIVKEVGGREDVGAFLFAFAALNPDRDTEYALEKLEEPIDEDFKKAIRIVLEEIVALDKPEPPLAKDFYLIFGIPMIPSPEVYDNEEKAIAAAEKAFNDDWASTITVVLHRVVWTKSK